MTLTLCTLYLKLMLQILCESGWFVGVRMVQGCEGVGDIPGIQGGFRGAAGSAQQVLIDTRTQT